VGLFSIISFCIVDICVVIGVGVGILHLLSLDNNEETEQYTFTEKEFQEDKVLDVAYVDVMKKKNKNR